MKRKKDWCHFIQNNSIVGTHYSKIMLQNTKGDQIELSKIKIIKSKTSQRPDWVSDHKLIMTKYDLV